MKPFLSALVLCPWLTLSAWSQTTPPQPLSLQDFLGLTNDQSGAIIKNNYDYDTFSFEQQQQIQQVQSQIALEIAKDSPDPVAVGNLYVSIEATCRSVRDKATNFQQLNISLLTDAQKMKLNVLNDAMRLVPAISQGQLENLLGSAVSAPESFATDWFNGAYYNGFRLRSVSGCASTGPVTIFPANPLAVVAPTGISKLALQGLVRRRR
jgi:hypothetical protein